MKKLNFINAVWKEGRYYIAQCLNVDVSSFGKTKKEALKNLQEALELCMEDMPISKISKIEKPSIEIQSLTHA